MQAPTEEPTDEKPAVEITLKEAPAKEAPVKPNCCSKCCCKQDPAIPFDTEISIKGKKFSPFIDGTDRKSAENSPVTPIGNKQDDQKCVGYLKKGTGVTIVNNVFTVDSPIESEHRGVVSFRRNIVWADPFGVQHKIIVPADFILAMGSKIVLPKGTKLYSYGTSIAMTLDEDTEVTV